MNEWEWIPKSRSQHFVKYKFGIIYIYHVRCFDVPNLHYYKTSDVFIYIGEKNTPIFLVS